MRTLDIVNRAARSLRNAKTRTVLTSLAIAVGAFTITISLAAGEGTRQYADTLINSNVNPQALFIVKDPSITEGPASQSPLRVYDENIGSTPTGLALEQMTQEDVDTLLERDDLTNVVPTYQPSVDFVQFEGSDTKFTADVSYYNTTIVTGLSKGKLPAQGTDLADSDIVVPGSYVETLIENDVIANADELIGKQITITASQATASPTSEQIAQALATGGQAALADLLQPVEKGFTYTVVAITEATDEALSTSTALQVSPNAAKEISEYTTQGTDQYQKYVGVTALAKDGLEPADVKAELQKEGYFPQTAKDLQGLVFTVVNTLQGIVLGFGIVALIASVFGIINTQYISVLERTREIGLMKALGMRGNSVSRLFQFEAAWIGFLGGAVGAALAALLGWVLNPIITEALGLSEGTYLLIFEPLAIAVMIVILVIIAMLAGWFPARKAAKLDPIEALRTE